MKRLNEKNVILKQAEDERDALLAELEGQNERVVLLVKEGDEVME